MTPNTGRPLATMPDPGGQQIPRWLFWGFLAKGLIVVAVTVTVLYYAGVF